MKFEKTVKQIVKGNKMSEFCWDVVFQLLSEENLEHYVSISPLKRAVQEDNPDALFQVIGHHTHASIYALIHCFTRPPALRCIHFLVSNGTPLHQTFPHNPFQKTAMEYLHTRFSPTSETFRNIKQTIDSAKKGHSTKTT